MIQQNCTYSVPLNGQGLTPSSTEPFAFSEVLCETATSSYTMNLFPQTYAIWQGSWFMFAIFVFIAFFFKNR